jgi:hypothetical protein
MSTPLDIRQRPAIIARLKETTEALGRLPTKREFWRLTRIPLKTVKKLFGGHRALLRAAGFQAFGSRRLVPNETLLRAMRDAFKAAGGIVGRDLFSRFCRHDIRTIVKRWGGWPRACAALRDWLESNEPDFVHLPELRERCRGIKAIVSPLPLAPRCGALMRFRALDHAPTTENAVIFLFGLVAEELGFVLESVGVAFPDAVGRRRVAHGWRHVRIEFELMSRTFRDDGHKARDCDLIVCWEDNWPESPLEVLELRREIAMLPNSVAGFAALHTGECLTKRSAIYRKKSRPLQRGGRTMGV